MRKSVTRAHLVLSATKATGMPKDNVALVGDLLFAALNKALMDGESVKLTGFGSLEVRDRAERTARNPRTGQECKIMSRQTVHFIPGGRLKAALLASTQVTATVPALPNSPENEP